VTIIYFVSFNQSVSHRGHSIHERCYGCSPKRLFPEPAIHRTPLVWAFTEYPLDMGFHRTIYGINKGVSVNPRPYGYSPNALISGCSPSPSFHRAVHRMPLYGCFHRMLMFTEWLILLTNPLITRFGESP